MLLMDLPGALSRPSGAPRGLRVSRSLPYVLSARTTQGRSLAYPQSGGIPKVVNPFLSTGHVWSSRHARSSSWRLPHAVPVSASTLPSSVKKVLPGTPEPLGPSKADNGSAVNFALFSQHASSVTLCLFDAATNKPLGELPLDAAAHKTGDVWHVQLQGLPLSGIAYGYRVAGEGGWEQGHRWDAGRVLLDPYAPLVNGRRVFGQRDELEAFKPKLGSTWLGTYDLASKPFDWGNGQEEVARPQHELKDLVIYEMSVRCFTADPSSGLPPGRRGTFLGLADKAEYLKKLGVNAVELLPVFEWDELEFQLKPNPRDHMVNVWGYSHLNFFAPMSRFAADGGGPVAAAREFKQMVKTLHAAGIEVILDVVYNHTAEADDRNPYTISWRGIDNKVYYMYDPSKQPALLNYSGCGNTINANHPTVAKLIIDSLVHWVTEYHIDGFRFDLASCLCRDQWGNALPAPPLIRAISKHPLLSRCKLIAEPWDLGMYQVGSFPNWDIWAEWNGRYRDDMRRFLKGEPGTKGPLATRLAGSADLYKTNKRKPFHSINFIIAHDGFSLADLVSYNAKRNDANGEGNRDGTNDNLSWNCGVEGETRDGSVSVLRYRQMRNAMVLLLVSQGTPMFVMGDEVAKSHGGNNNWYGHDKPMGWLQWGEADGDKQALLRFVSLLVALRRAHPVLRRAEFLAPGDITWHETAWDNAESRFLAFTLHDASGLVGDLYCALNAHGHKVEVTLPAPPAGRKWCRVVDTNLPSPRDFTPGGNRGVDPKYGMEGHSALLLWAREAAYQGPAAVAG